MAKGPGGAWTHLPVPFDVNEVFGSKARLLVAGTINGFPFRNSLMPEGDGTHSMMVSKELQTGANARAGDIVSVTLEPDIEERVVSMPPELEAALTENQLAAAVFDMMTYSQRKEYVVWISTAKQEATKANRVKKAVDMLSAGKKRLR
jgi:Bacteriocin-protection, YdeI or OmpD-Associated/Domain of unknown function (DUF1905)